MAGCAQMPLDAEESAPGISQGEHDTALISKPFSGDCLHRVNPAAYIPRMKQHAYVAHIM